VYHQVSNTAQWTGKLARNIPLLPTMLNIMIFIALDGSNAPGGASEIRREKGKFLSGKKPGKVFYRSKKNLAVRWGCTFLTA
jgi:hypothetical protein